MISTNVDETNIVEQQENIQQEANDTKLKFSDINLEAKKTLNDTAEIVKEDNTVIKFSDESMLSSVNTNLEENKQFNYDMIITLLGLTTLISLLISFWLYKWRKVVIAGKDIVVPETFAKQVDGIVQAVTNSGSELRTVVNQQNGAVNQFSGSLKNLDESIKSMIDTYMSLQTALDQKDEEIGRFKEGYDSKIFHNFLLRFTRVDRVIQEYLEDGKIDLEGLRDIHEVMEDALKECGVELFSPNTGESYLDLDGIAANPKKIDTKDKSQNLTICEVIKAGYKRKLPNSKFEIITQAKVSIFTYKAESQQSEELQTDEKLEG
jgi:hypothetical protein